MSYCQAVHVLNKSWNINVTGVVEIAFKKSPGKNLEEATDAYSLNDHDVSIGTFFMYRYIMDII